MDETNIGSEGSQRQYVVDPNTITITPFVTGVNNNYLNSSIGVSQQESAHLGIEANSPRLSMPTVGAFILSMQNQTATITLDALKAWGKSLEEQAARVKEELNTPRYLDLQADKSRVSIASSDGKIVTTNASHKTEFTEVDLNLRHRWLLSLGALVTVAIQLSEGAAAAANGTGASTVSGVAPNNFSAAAPGIAPISGENASVGSQSIASKILTSGASLAAAGVIFFQAPITSIAQKSGLHNEIKVYNEAWGGLTSYSVDPASQTAGWFSAMWGIGLIYQLSAEKLGSYASLKTESKPTRDINFVKNYALQALNTIQTPAFNLSIQAMLIASTGKAPQGEASNAHLETLMAKAKLVILSLALALLAKLEVGSRSDEGWINELEFNGLVNGETDITKDDIFETAGIKQNLIKEINTLLAGLPSGEKDNVMYRLSSYMSNNPAIEEMLDQQNAFETVFNPPPSIGEKRILENPS
ncbi:MAG: hypothetical protein H0W50_04050 [Parachlamydiaceae bacterium]|nr:hypothetical protein [Parachlamydiaceae bacterium]